MKKIEVEQINTKYRLIDGCFMCEHIDVYDDAREVTYYGFSDENYYPDYVSVPTQFCYGCKAYWDFNEEDWIGEDD